MIFTPTIRLNKLVSQFFDLFSFLTCLSIYFDSFYAKKRSFSRIRFEKEKFDTIFKDFRAVLVMQIYHMTTKRWRGILAQKF